MELDNLKTLWQDLDEREVRLTDDEKIIQMLRKRSQSPIATMKRNLFFELIAVIILYSFTIWYFLATSMGRYSEIAVLLLFVGILFILYYYRKNKLLGQMQCVTCEVRSNLQQQLRTLEKYVRFYFLSGILLTPFAYFATGLIVLLKYPGKDIIAGFTSSDEYFLFISIGIVITVASYFLNRWYIKKLYGQHIKRLKELLVQMDEKEPVFE